MQKKRCYVPLIFFLVIAGIYFITSPGRTPYDYFTRLSEAFLSGKYYLQDNPAWLNELIPAGLHKFYVVYPPMPAILLMPFIFLFGQKFQQQFLAYILGAGLAAMTVRLSFLIKDDKKLAIWSGTLTGLGTIIWFLSSVGSVWYLGQITAAFFLMAALIEALGKKRSFLIGLFLGAAYLSRLQVVLSLPLFLYLLRGKDWLKNYLRLGLGIVPFVILDFCYNFIRFEVIWDKAYFLIPGVLKEPWFKKGLYSLSYIPNNLKVAFLSLPIFLKSSPYIIPSWGGLSILITTPAFIYSLSAKIKENVVKFSWISIVLIALIVLGHGSSGFAQFGYRFAVDFYPILIFLTIKGVARKGLRWHHYLLLSLSVLVNLWGVLWINKFGWVSP